MGSFNSLERSDQVERRNIGKRFVYLESEEDVQVFRERWFFERGEQVEFVPVSDGSNGGCNDVIARVAADRAAGIDAWGVVDRDVLAARGEWEAFFDADDDSFLARKVFGDHVLVLRCWEMENYLFHPEVLENHLADTQGRSVRPPAALVEELFEIVCCKLPIVAANLILNSYGKKQLPAQFGHRDDCSKLLDSVELWIEQAGIPAEVLDDCLCSIASFGEQYTPRTQSHWLGLLRILDGKLLVDWLKGHYKLQDECRFSLARRMKEQGKVGEMLEKPLWDLACGYSVQ